RPTLAGRRASRVDPWPGLFRGGGAAAFCDVRTRRARAPAARPTERRVRSDDALVAGEFLIRSGEFSSGSGISVGANRLVSGRLSGGAQLDPVDLGPIRGDRNVGGSTGLVRNLV